MSKLINIECYFGHHDGSSQVQCEQWILISEFQRLFFGKVSEPDGQLKEVKKSTVTALP